MDLFLLDSKKSNGKNNKRFMPIRLAQIQKLLREYVKK